MSTPLKFYLGEESHYIIEDYDTIKEKSSEKSIFADQYKKALQVIDAFIDAKDNKNSSMLQESRNNVIAFMGDRGTGKTSCMMSVLNMLDQHLNEKHTTTTSVEMVDPSFF
jgi:putative ribosome biogenesis GTPase RsgA